MRKPRNLSPEERALWESVARRATPLEKARSALPEPKAVAASARTRSAEAATAIPPFEIGSKTNGATVRTDLAPSVSDRLATAPVQMDRKAFRKMSRGKLDPDARIDLHGMTLDEAHPALISFILSEQARGSRLVLVITGKGRARAPEQRGVLRRQVPHWLRMAPVGQAVLEIREAHLKHGGSGAFYVYLRRSR
ncbi:Smr/MutS family protein [Aestuariibius sp. 2305UL40-4]|uniref:Smr/MutS family protein n=1 Tax=Aestuariibius violaceus TaxID=3234132 RepID=UPI00345ED394